MTSTIRLLVSRITRMFPLYSGGSTIANSPLLDGLSRAHVGRVWTRVKGGVVSARLDDYVGRSAYYTGDIDRKVTWIYRKIVRNGDTALDIGTNIGIVTLGLSKIVGSKGKVHSFEPNRELVNVLNDTIERNRITNVCIHPVALGRKVEDKELFIPEGNTGAASLLSVDEETQHDTMTVSVNSLSNFAKQESIESIRFIKIDVEGFELDVLEGGLDVLDDIQPETILFECNLSESCIADDIPVYRLLCDHGYTILSIPRCLLKMRLKNLPPETQLAARGYDFLAVKQGQVYEEISKLLKL